MKYFQYTTLVIAVCFIAMPSVESVGYKGIHMNKRGVPTLPSMQTGTLVLQSASATDGYFVIRYLGAGEEANLIDLVGKEVTLFGDGADSNWHAKVDADPLFLNTHPMLSTITEWAPESKATLSTQPPAKPKVVKLTALAKGR